MVLEQSEIEELGARLDRQTGALNILLTVITW